MRIEYIADDGKIFDNENDCSEYELLLKHPNLKDIKIYNEDGVELVDFLAEDTYLNFYKIIVPNNDCLNDLRELVDYTGYNDYLQITEPGIWEEDKHSNSMRFKLIKTGDIIRR